MVTFADGSSLGADMKIWDIATAKELKTINIGFVSLSNLYFLDDTRFMVLMYGKGAVYNIYGEQLEKFDFPKSTPSLLNISRNKEYGFYSYYGGSVNVSSMKDGSEVVLPEISANKDKVFGIHLTDIGFGYYGIFYKPTYDDLGGNYVIYNDNLDIIARGRIHENFSIYDKYVKISSDLRYVAYRDLAGNKDVIVVDLSTGRTVATIHPRAMRQKKSPPFGSGIDTLGGDEDFDFSFLLDGRLLLEYIYNRPELKGSDCELNFITLQKNGIYTEKKVFLTDYHKLTSSDYDPFFIGKNSVIYTGYPNGDVKTVSIGTGEVLNQFGVIPLTFYMSASYKGKLINSQERNSYSEKLLTLSYNLWDLENLKLEKLNVTSVGSVYKKKYTAGKDMVFEGWHLYDPIKFYSVVPQFFFKDGYKDEEDTARGGAIYGLNNDGKYHIKQEQHALLLSDPVTKAQRARLYAFADGEWVIITPDGYYTASENGEKYINVRIDKNVYTLGNYREAFFRPDLVKLALEGKSLDGLKNISDMGKPPVIGIINTPSTTDKPTVDITVKITDSGGGIGAIRLFINGTGVMTDNARSIKAQQNKNELIKTYTVKLPSGISSVKAVAFDADDNVQSNSAEMRIASNITAVKKPNLYALAVGINTYRNPKINLKFAVADAELFASSIKKSSSPLFAKTEVTLLTTREQTSKESITKALESFKSMNPEDIFVFFVASHGTVDDGEYFLITSNVGALGTDRLKTDALTQAQLKEQIANIPSTKKLVLIDTCNAGKLGEELSAAMMTRGMNEDTAMKILSRAVGSTVISASTSHQEAMEGYQGHGLFTKTFTDGLSGQADSDKDGFIKTTELANYIEETVPELAQKFFNRPQFPTVNTAGQSFPIGRN